MKISGRKFIQIFGVVGALASIIGLYANAQSKQQIIYSNEGVIARDIQGGVHINHGSQNNIRRQLVLDTKPYGITWVTREPKLRGQVICKAPSNTPVELTGNTRPGEFNYTYKEVKILNDACGSSNIVGWVSENAFSYN